MSIDSCVSFGVYNTPPSVSYTAYQDLQDTSSNAGTLVTENYVILNLLGSGGFASVYKAESKQDQDLYAIKVMLRVHRTYDFMNTIVQIQIIILFLN
ncbi:uncharacterized protein MELLADRAFT_92118 [Melampsora larici-populina 98AG31]|uniref:Protein kinase domain-containing protein n=1 Tax=Melampsora larici-populina (strain 98AG31 / pathotype 3-4-7) TaxID=747676 RepID=F4S1K1_MELLP|nr:uncharacterized protein MELLADRAFT_92118 [Melampsora larici-populina 98AG31]EGG01491.1 hypothetical protein MELLADRAFT_92118 [Melampsora larici-populina 98AG31]